MAESDNNENVDGSNEVPTSALWAKIAGALILGAIIVVFAWGPLELGEALFDAWRSETGPWGGIAFAAFYIVATVCFVPAAVLGVGAGFLFGGVWGSVIAVLCRPLGALVAFLVGRHLARDHVRHWIDDWPKFEAIDRVTDDEPFQTVLLMRIVPILTYNLTSYVFGLTAVDWKRFFLATFVGVLPGSLFYVYLGVIASDLTRALTLEEAAPWTEHAATWTITAVAFAALLGYLFWRARKKWKEIMAEDQLETQSQTS